MALVVFLRGVNVGGHRRFRPSLLAQELSAYEVVNVGAAGTLVVRKPGSRARFKAALRRKLPFTAEIFMCEGRELQRLAASHPFGEQPAPAGVVRFVSVVAKPGGLRTPLPAEFPPAGGWLVRVLAVQGRFVLGEYRRHMKTIGYLGKLDGLFGCRATTRNWNTIETVLRLLDQRSVVSVALPA